MKTPDSVTTPDFASLGLAAPLLKALAGEGYTQPTPIQAQAIPQIRAGRDLLGIAQTGTGKTAAFLLPILDQLNAMAPLAGSGVKALILAPTRELAVQIGEAIGVYGRHLPFSHGVVCGGIPINRQIARLARGVDLVVATPGRLLDLIQQRKIRLGQVRHLVLDEADRMLDMGFIRDVRKIVAALPRQRQSMLFSATMPEEIGRLAADMLDAPVRVEVTPPARTVARIAQSVMHVNGTDKRAILVHLLRDPAMTRVIVFTRTKRGANKVCETLARSAIPAEALHGNKSQPARQRALAAFRDGTARVLVATDIAARGIDVDGISHVINFELPNEAESYVHRIGRTARAGAEGIAIALCDASERGYLKDIEKLTRQRLWVAPTPDFKPLALAPRESTPAKGGKASRRDEARRPAKPQGQRRRWGKNAQARKAA
ncbi:MAG: DEAD/DEAH box helicase [Pseudomonadota bacterium]